ncbi:hypothetical protein BCR42DRAFT_406841 [Absidia repens]|uniref:Uncharacterized protein n=1 Tax=Absidia repens TaxID=90262 RepID=A0A1X2IRF6_9FUNG|nr:hypothetical protein BCR42DRAFT_406841 [Absidia repens]
MPSNIIVDCTWPCPGENDQACILSETSLNCQQKRNSQWVWTDPHLSPQYDGEPARLHQPCITVPSFQPPATIYSSPNNTQSSVEWPPNDKYQPMDQYLSDCNPANYCEQGTCVPKFDPGQPCVSTNQCLSGVCNSNTNTCEKDSSPSSPPSQQQQHQQENDHQQNDQTKTNGVSDGPWSKPTFTTSHLVGVIIAVIVLLAAILFFYFYRRRKRASRIVTSSTSDNNSSNNDSNKVNSLIPRSLHENGSSPILPLSHINNPTSSLQPPPLPSQSALSPQAFPSSSSTSTSSSSSPSSTSPSPPTNPVHATVQSHPSTDINTTPSMQQQQLQFQLQRQHPSLSHGSSTSPPPYSP